MSTDYYAVDETTNQAFDIGNGLWCLLDDSILNSYDDVLSCITGEIVTKEMNWLIDDDTLEHCKSIAKKITGLGEHTSIITHQSMLEIEIERGYEFCQLSS